MKTLLMSVAMLLAVGFISVNAQSEEALASVEGITTIEKRVKIAKDELPEAVSEAFDESDYAEWEFIEAFKVTDEEAEMVSFEIHVKNGEALALVVYDEEGNDITPEEEIEEEE